MDSVNPYDDKISWIRDLVKAEEQMEEAGVVDLATSTDSKDKVLVQESLRFLQALKNKFIETSVTFNELKTSASGRIKIYGIAQTAADFMLFRNGYKMIFTLTGPGEISIKFNFLGNGGHIPPQIPALNSTGATKLIEENILKLREAPFNDLRWTFNDQEINADSLVKFHMSIFIRESMS